LYGHQKGLRTGKSLQQKGEAKEKEKKNAMKVIKKRPSCRWALVNPLFSLTFFLT